MCWGGGCSGWEGGGLCGAKDSALCPLQPDGWQELTGFDSGILNLHDVNKSSSGTYMCQSLDLDDMSQKEETVDVVVNCKREGTGPC